MIRRQCGNLAFPIAGHEGALVAYINRSLEEKPPVFSFVEFNPAEHTFGRIASDLPASDRNAALSLNAAVASV
jgi:hypothetical protein